MKALFRKVGSYEKLSQLAALEIKKKIQSGNPVNLGLPTGGTPIGMYKELVNDSHIDWWNVTTFNLDEYIGIDPKQTIEDNSRFFDSIEEVPTQAVTMGLETIMKSDEILLIAQGKKKLNIIKEAMFGDITEDIPASILQEHENLTILYCE
jgi:6-phosphogluconolactonase/glucosamine-6-phosphate isomerase/deaminase